VKSTQVSKLAGRQQPAKSSCVSKQTQGKAMFFFSSPPHTFYKQSVFKQGIPNAFFPVSKSGPLLCV
jgi:hypothetical protein